MRLVRLRKTSRPHSEQSVTRLRSELGTPKNETGMVERLDGILEQHARYVVHETGMVERLDGILEQYARYVVHETGMVERLDGILEKHARYVVHETTDSLPTADPRVKMLNPLNVLLTLSRNIRRNAARIRVKLSLSTA
jgi:hypothetical protein